MTGFVFGGQTSCDASIVPPPAPLVDAVITNDGFFPDVDAADFRKAARVRDGVTPERLREALLGAIITAGNDLDAWAAGQIAAGNARLADVPASELAGESRLLIMYRRAISAFAKAELVERNRDVDTTASGDRKLDALEQTPDELRRDGLHAVRDILGVGRTNVELI